MLETTSRTSLLRWRRLMDVTTSARYHTNLHSNRYRCTPLTIVSQPSTCILTLTSSSSSSALSISSSIYFLPYRNMANREQKDKDRANMKKKQEKAAAIKQASHHKSTVTGDLPEAAVKLLDTLETKIDATLAHLSRTLQDYNVARISPSLFDNISITKADGTIVPLSSLCAIANKSSSSLSFTLFHPHDLKPIMKVLQTMKLPGLSNIGTLNPQVSQLEGEVTEITINVMKMNHEARQEMIKNIQHHHEESKSILRVHRQTILHQMKKESNGWSDMDKEKIKQQIQSMIDGGMEEMNHRVKQKEKEIQET